MTQENIIGICNSGLESKYSRIEALENDKMSSMRVTLAAMSYENESDSRREIVRMLIGREKIQTTVFTSLQARLWMIAAPRICRSSEFESNECTATLVVTLMLLIF